MTRPNRHRVQRQVIDLAIGDSAQGPALQGELARSLWDRAVPELEEVFDRAAGPHELLRLDRLEIDLGRIAGVDWTTQFRRKLVAELTRSLARFRVVPEAGDVKLRSESQPAEPWQQFLFFLVHGRLPWWGTKPSEGWTEALVHGSDAVGWSGLHKTALSDTRARVRLVHSVSDQFLDAAIANWSGLLHAARVLEQLTPTGLRADARRQWRRGFWIIVLDWVLAGGYRLQRGPQLMRDLLVLRHTYVSEGEQRRPLPPLSRGANDRAEPIRTAEGSNLPDPWHEWQMSEGKVGPLQHVAPETRTDAGTAIVRAPALFSSRDAAPDKVFRPSEESDAIYLEGAGAILLHPFLEQLFRERGLLDGRTFRETEARHRAVHLLGLLTFGRVDVPEYELLLAKLLCGSAFEEPIEPVQLEDDDHLACDALLRSVLEHWTALRSSSPDWLRGQFFLREGKLESVDSGHRLTIERRAQDVLLVRLPWGCGVIGLPWLNERIFVRWLE